MSYLCTRKQAIRATAKQNGVLVQLVRIHACHAWGHGFESRTHRQPLRPSRCNNLEGLLLVWMLERRALGSVEKSIGVKIKAIPNTFRLS